MRIPALFKIAPVCLMLAACSGEDESVNTGEIEMPDETAAQSGLTETAPETPEQRRQRLRERMADYREETGEADTEPLRQRRERMRERRDQTGRWWTDESLAAGLELSDEQISAIESAASERLKVAREVRSELTRLRRQRSGDLGTEAAMDARQAARERLAQAERQWLASLHEILTDDQIEALEDQHPEALTRATPRPRVTN